MAVLSLEQRIAGCLLGMAIGDALGLPCEGLTPGRQARLFPDLSRYHFVWGHGMVSDDTEHACMTAQALLSSADDEGRFLRALAWKLRFWLLGLPAGVGMATLKACLRLWLGWPPARSGVVSAGNGPAMRALILGVVLGERPQQLKRWIRLSTGLTHRDPRAEAGALALALAAWHFSTGPADPVAYLEQLTLLCPEHTAFVTLIGEALSQSTLPDLISLLDCQRGISGYMLHTAPAVIWLSFGYRDDFSGGLQAAIRCGGDTDTVAALLGGVLGAGLGSQALPPKLLTGLWEWPRSPAWILELARRLASARQGVPTQPLGLNPLALLLRNGLFMMLVLLHGFRRLLPPYSR
ncbi:MAG: dinitrogenase reductase [Candidatus Melainabacteria bacterium HGW-Melainabacteria-1]|nr:MAG: dinitrogenase reductase [Candidatus Melainabacteria bacterium HGW-Melainabacteria-1]